VLKLMFGAMIRAAEHWRAIKITDFRRRQMAAVKQELDPEYEAAIAHSRQHPRSTRRVQPSRNRSECKTSCKCFLHYLRLIS
jgi:hypothetical protein